MATQDIDDNLIFVDACLTSHWASNRSVLERLRRGGLTAANANRITWEGFADTMALISQYKTWMEQNSDVVRQVYTVEDIHTARQDDRLGIFLGFQNTSPLDDKLYYLRLFHELGVRVVQLTYSTANSVGGGCYEAHDIPLTDYGRDVVAELNRLGILIDLSHCGAQIAADTIAVSSQPVAYTHTCPAALRASRRNKSDEQIRDIAEHGGVIGIAAVLAFQKAGREATIDDYLDTIEYVIGLAGEAHVGIGLDVQTDIQEITDYDARGEYSSRDKGYGRYYIGDMPEPAPYASLMREKSTPTGMSDLSTRGTDLANAMARRGWSDDRIANVLGRNWLRLFTEVWGAGVPSLQAAAG